MQFMPPVCIGRHAVEQAANDARIAEVERHARDTGDVQRVECEFEHFEVGFEAGMAVDLGAELQRFARSVQAGRTGAQQRPAIAQAGHAAAVEQMRIDARHLRRRVGAHAESAAAQLVDELEGLQVEFAIGTRTAFGEQRLDMFEQWRHDQLETVAARRIEQPAAEFLDTPRLGRQDIGNMLGQQPGRRHEGRVQRQPAKNESADCIDPPADLGPAQDRRRCRRPPIAQCQNTSSMASPASMLLRPRKRI